jgi:hypothetical protein
MASGVEAEDFFEVTRPILVKFYHSLVPCAIRASALTSDIRRVGCMHQAHRKMSAQR